VHAGRSLAPASAKELKLNLMLDILVVLLVINDEIRTHEWLDAAAWAVYETLVVLLVIVDEIRIHEYL
jgi:hypothetical protein